MLFTAQYLCYSCPSLPVLILRLLNAGSFSGLIKLPGGSVTTATALSKSLAYAAATAAADVLPDLVLLSITVVAYPSYHKTICPIHYPRSFHLKA